MNVVRKDSQHDTDPTHNENIGAKEKNTAHVVSSSVLCSETDKKNRKEEGDYFQGVESRWDDQLTSHHISCIHTTRIKAFQSSSQ